MNSRQVGLVALLAVLVYASNQLFHREEALPATTAEHARVPDAYASDIRLDILDTHGKPVYRLQAASMEFYPDIDQLELQQPRLKLDRSDGSLWNLQAEAGQTSQAGDIVRLLGKVSLQTGNDSTPTTIDTRDVTVRPAEKTAETDQAAHISGNGMQLDTTGFRADLNRNRLELRSQVKGQLREAF